MPKTRSSSGAPRKEGFNRSNHSMNPERLTGSLKGVANPRTKGKKFVFFNVHLTVQSITQIIVSRNHQTTPNVQKLQSETRS